MPGCPMNFVYRWFCGLSIEDKIPDHSTFSRARHERFRDSDMFRRVFERVVGSCIAAGLVGGEGFAVVGYLIVADANKQRSIPGSEWNKRGDPQGAGRAMREYLATLDDAAFAAASEVTPKFVSPSDPAAQWTGAMRGPAFFAYADNYLIDVKFGIILDVKATRAIRQAEVGAAKTMSERTEEGFDIKPAYLAADTAYGSADTLNWIVNKKKIAPHIPVIDKSKREDGTFSREDFRFDEERNVYFCPAGKVLTTTGHIGPDHALRYQASLPDCRACVLKPKCCPKMPSRRIVRDVNEDARDIARALAKTEAFARSRRDRKRVEMLFAHLKRILRLPRPPACTPPPCASGGFGYAPHAARKMSSRSPQSRKTYAASQNWSLDRHQRSMHLLPNQRGAKSLVGALPLAKKRHSRKTCQQIEAVLSHSNRRLLQQNLPVADISNRSITA